MRSLKQIRKVLFARIAYRWCAASGMISWKEIDDIDLSSPVSELMTAVIVLFSSTGNYYIPAGALKYYGGILGLKIQKAYCVTSDLLVNQPDYSKMRKLIFERLMLLSGKDMDRRALLGYLDQMGRKRSYFTENIESKDYTVVSMDNAGVRSSGTLYTFAQTGCVVVAIKVNHDQVILAHYNRERINTLFEKVRELLTGTKIGSLDAYLISYNPFEDAELFWNIVAPPAGLTNVFFHLKAKNIENRQTYNIKVGAGQGGIGIFYSHLMSRVHIHQGFTGLYLSDARAFNIEAGYEEMPLESMGRASRSSEIITQARSIS